MITEATQDLLCDWDQNSAQDKLIDIAAEMSRLTLRIIGMGSPIVDNSHIIDPQANTVTAFILISTDSY